MSYTEAEPAQRRGGDGDTASKKLAPRVDSVLMALGVLKSDVRPLASLITAEVVIEGPEGKRTLKALIDSGASDNFISHLIAAEERLPAERTTIKAHSIAGHSIQIYGRHACDATVKARR